MWVTLAVGVIILVVVLFALGLLPGFTRRPWD
jgi:hypothetical protein